MSKTDCIRAIGKTSADVRRTRLPLRGKDFPLPNRPRGITANSAQHRNAVRAMAFAKAILRGPFPPVHRRDRGLFQHSFNSGPASRCRAGWLAVSTPAPDRESTPSASGPRAVPRACGKEAAHQGHPAGRFPRRAGAT